MEYDKFYGKITKIGDSAWVLIPSNIMKFGGLEISDDVELMVRKKKEVV